MIKTIMLASFAIVLASYAGITQTELPRSDNRRFAQNLNLPNTLGVHPLGIYISRIEHRFQKQPTRKLQLDIAFSQANIWSPPVKAYRPLVGSDQQFIQSIVWHDKQRLYDVSTPADTSFFHADGVYQRYQFTVQLPISKNQELYISTQALVLQRGRYTLFTSDNFIEWFHSNIAGGEDPFDRRLYGLNKAGIQYVDLAGNHFEVERGQFTVPNIKADYYYYIDWDWLHQRRIALKLGGHMGSNISKINSSIDLGISSMVLKEISLSKLWTIDLALSSSALRQKVFDFGHNVSIASNPYLISGEIMAAFTKKLKNDNHLTMATTWWIQNALNKSEELNELVLTGQRSSPHWHLTMNHLYRSTTANSFILSYTASRFTSSIYLREDFKVDNAPDIQTGVSLKFRL